jgi:hypothetical protein
MYSEKLLRWLKKKNLLSQAKSNSKIFKKVLKESMGLNNEELLIIGDYGSFKKRISPILTGSYYLAAKSLGLKVKLVMQGIKDASKDADMEVIQALKALPVKKSAVVVNVSNKIGGFKGLGRSFRRYMKYKNSRFVSTSGLGSLRTSKIFSIIKAYDIDYNKLKIKQAILKKELDKARLVRFVTKAGTDITFDVQGNKSISIDGDYKNNFQGGNLPAGEVYIAPKLNGANGILVIDGSSRVSEGTILIKKPITMIVRNGSVISIKGGLEARYLSWTLSKAMRRAKKPANVKKLAEIGIGMNPKANIVGAMVVDEKSYGTVHIALGSNYWFGGPVRSLVHLDQVMKDPKVYIDGKLFNMPKKRDLI